MSRGRLVRGLRLLEVTVLDRSKVLGHWEGRKTFFGLSKVSIIYIVAEVMQKLAVHWHKILKVAEDIMGDDNTRGFKELAIQSWDDIIQTVVLDLTYILSAGDTAMISCLAVSVLWER
jgi:hypothetical protein